MNFLHFAVLMFAICVIVLIAVSLMTPAPNTDKIAGLTFQTKRAETAMSEIEESTPAQRQYTMAFTVVLVGTMISLWFYFA